MRSPDRHERSPGNPDYESMADQNDRSLASVGDNRLPFVIGGGKPAGPRPISLDPLLAEICSLRRRQPGPFRTSRADGYPGRAVIDNPFLDRIRADRLGHVTYLAE